MSKIEEKNALWVALNFIFPKAQKRGEVYVKKSTAFKVFVDEELVASVNKDDDQTFISNMKMGCKVDILKGNSESGEVFSSFSWIVGRSHATLYLSESVFKKVKMNFANRNRVEVFDERDFELINSNGEIVIEDEAATSDNI